jgi:hypothetical protein
MKALSRAGAAPKKCDYNALFRNKKTTLGEVVSYEVFFTSGN